MASRAEEIIASCLRPILAELPSGALVPDSKEFRDALGGLEWIIPDIIGEIHSEMLGQCLDGVLPAVARKTGDEQIEIFGLCIFIEDQTVTPLHVQLQIAETTDEISWMECRLGERGERGMVRTPYSSPTGMLKRTYAMACNCEPNEIDWVYQVTFGKRRIGCEP